MSTDALNATAPAPKMVKLRLLRNYRPFSDTYEVLGYHKEPVLVKRPDGKIVQVEPGGFMQETDDDGKFKPAPPALPGTGFADRLNAGTIVRLPTEEAKRVRAEKIGEVEIDD